MVPVGDERRALQAPSGPEPDPGGELVPDEAQGTRAGERPEVRELLGLDQPLDRLPEGEAGGDEDGEDDRVAGPSLGPPAPKQEGRADRDGCQRVARVVDEIREKGDASGEDVDSRLSAGRPAEDGEADGHGPQPRAGAEDRVIHEPVRVPAVGVAVVLAGAPAHDALASPAVVAAPRRTCWTW